MEQISDLSIKTIRTLALDSVEAAQHGHLGMPLGSTPMAYELWINHLNVNPDNSHWFNRDRFVLSAGHGSILNYILLHLSGYDMTLDDLKGFRQIGSRTPGHPEFGHTDGIEVTTGPLGQGVGHSVGLAIAEKYLGAIFNKPGFNIIDYHTYAICSDGDLMEGVAYEAASIAGHLGLGKLILLFDSNDVVLDGNVDDSFSEDIKGRFESMNWQHLSVEDGHDLSAIGGALSAAREETEKPSIIEVKNTIGYGIEHIQGTHNAHSDPIGAEAVKKAKSYYRWAFTEDFHVPSEVYEHFEKIRNNGKTKEKEWLTLLGAYEEKFPEDYRALKQVIHKKLNVDADSLEKLFEYTDKISTRAASNKLINHFANDNISILGGSADLSKSNKTTLEKFPDFNRDSDYHGRNIKFGVREFAMGTIGNALSLSSLRPYISTFFVFSDYMRPAIRLAALMRLPITYIFTHDSVAVGQDGPTHQPVEHLASFRAMPNINVIRPADALETIGAWLVSAYASETPTLLALGRQDVPVLKQDCNSIIEGTQKGAYILQDKEHAKGILLATGSEIHLALQAQTLLEDQGIKVNVVSMPSWELFESQDENYKKSVLDPNIRKRLAIELGSKLGWQHYITEDGDIMSVDTFGESGAGNDVVNAKGFTADRIVARYKAL